MIQKLKSLLSKFSWFDWFLVVVIAFVTLVCILRWYKDRLAENAYIQTSTDVTEIPVVKKIWVDVAGAVVAPGPYQMNEGERIKDLIVACGGLSGEADREAVAKLVNMAEKLKDSQKIYIPKKASNNIGQEKQAVSTKTINVNLASEEELNKLWGVGEARAKQIIEGRPYGSIDELVERKILTRSIVDRNKNLISVY